MGLCPNLEYGLCQLHHLQYAKKRPIDLPAQWFHLRGKSDSAQYRSGLVRPDEGLNPSVPPPRPDNRRDRNRIVNILHSDSEGALLGQRGQEATEIVHVESS